jgi:hypothetical protein
MGNAGRSLETGVQVGDGEQCWHVFLVCLLKTSPGAAL